jgi:hypothetical protein
MSEAVHMEGPRQGYSLEAVNLALAVCTDIDMTSPIVSYTDLPHTVLRNFRPPDQDPLR